MAEQVVEKPPAAAQLGPARPMTPPSATLGDWVFLGVPLPAQPSADQAHAAVMHVLTSTLGLSWVLPATVTVIAIAAARSGPLLVVRLQDTQVERAMRSAKRQLGAASNLSIFPHAAPQQRELVRRARWARARPADGPSGTSTMAAQPLRHPSSTLDPSATPFQPTVHDACPISSVHAAPSVVHAAAPEEGC